MVHKDIDGVRQQVDDKMQRLPRLEEKLESANTRILYLVKRVNQLSKYRGDGAGSAPTQERLMRVAEKLRDLGVIIEYTDGRGYAKLKALDSRGNDCLKRMSTVFPLSLIESYLDNVERR
ncbi:MAG TPA: hypothetical protein ENN67_05925 [Firmicutes bacterium]|nr:hypothetical protein [Bacillota bacterium]